MMRDKISSARTESMFKCAVLGPSRLSVRPPDVGVGFAKKAKVEMEVNIRCGCCTKILLTTQVHFLCGMTQELEVTNPRRGQRQTTRIVSFPSLPLLIGLLVSIPVLDVAETTKVEAGRVFHTDVTPERNLFQFVDTQGRRGGD